MIQNAIAIFQTGPGLFTVCAGEKSASPLTFEEMLGLVAQLTMGERKALCWMKSHDDINQRWRDATGVQSPASTKRAVTPENEETAP